MYNMMTVGLFVSYLIFLDIEKEASIWNNIIPVF